VPPKTRCVVSEDTEIGWQRPLSAEKLAWSRRRAGNYGAWAMGQVEPDAQGVYRIAAPLGGITVHSRWSLFSPVNEGFELTPGVQEAHIEVRRLPSAWIRLVDGDTSVPLDWSVEVDVEGSGQGQAPRCRVIQHGRALIVGPEPGRFMVRIAGLPGFRPIPERVIELRPGEPEEHVIELRRR
jgi:hypothetical protein